MMHIIPKGYEVLKYIPFMKKCVKYLNVYNMNKDISVINVMCENSS